MKKLAFTLGMLFMVLNFGGDAGAALFFDFYGDNVFFGNGGETSYTWNLDLDNDDLLFGDVDAEDQINWSQFVIKLYDDECDGSEWANLNIDNSLNWNIEVPHSLIGEFNVTSYLVDDHYLSITLDLLNLDDGGDFWVDYIAIVGDYTDNPAPVPEPATLILLGPGLLGLAAFRKKIFKK